MGKEKPQNKTPQKLPTPRIVHHDKSYEKGRIGVEKLCETLFKNPNAFECTTVDQRISMLQETLKDKGTFRELMSAGDEGATARLLSIVFGTAVPALVARQAVSVMTGDTPSVRIPIGQPATAYQVGGKGGAPVSGEKYTYQEIVARLWECVPVVPRTLVEDAAWDVIERQYAEASRALALAENDEICVDIISDAATADAVNGVTQSSPTVWTDVAQACGKVEAKHAATANYPADNGWIADTLIVNSAEYWELMRDTNIIQLQTFGMSPPAIQTGKIPRLGGLQILKTNSMTAGKMIVLDSKNVGVLYLRRDITLENYADPIADLVGAVLTSRFRYETVRYSAISLID